MDEHKELAIDHGGDPPGGILQGPGVKGPVAAALFLSIDQISRDSALATGYPFLAACLDRKDNSFELLEAALAQARNDAIRVLDKYVFITRRPAESALNIHRLIH